MRHSKGVMIALEGRMPGMYVKDAPVQLTNEIMINEHYLVSESFFDCGNCYEAHSTTTSMNSIHLWVNDWYLLLSSRADESLFWCRHMALLISCLGSRNPSCVPSD